MAIDKRAASAVEAVAGIADGASVMISGFGGAGFPNVLIRALREAGPRELTLIVNSATHRYSLTHELIEAGQVRRVICTAARGREAELSPFERLWKAGKIELECIPQGTFSERIRAGGAGIPAFYTPVGVGTVVADGKEVRAFDGRPHLLERALAADAALIRADRADRLGNCAFRYAQANFSPAMATASRLTIAEVRVVEEGFLAHTEIGLPGVFVRRVLAVGDAR
jgi:3-oxoadipate CoA-transferase alpha subunit